MSAAATNPAPQSTPIRNFCKTPASYFHRLLGFYNYTQLKLFGAVLVMTVGQTDRSGQDHTWAEITDEQFSEMTGVSSEWWQEALQTLTDQLKLVRVRKNSRGRLEYALSANLDHETKALTVRGRCAGCKTVGAFETRFVPVPHAAFRKLGACIDHASYACLMVIVAQSLAWDRTDGAITAKFTQLEIDDFERVTNLERRSITNALAKLCDPNGWALVERKERPGKPALYRAVPERFNKIEPRDPRVVVMPEPRERTANTTSAGLREKSQKTPDTQAIESDDRYYGFCKSCGHYCAVEELSERELAETGPPERSKPPRAGPGREKWAKETNWEKTKRSIWEMFIAK